MLEISINKIELERELTQKLFDRDEIESFIDSIKNVAMKMEDV